MCKIKDTKKNYWQYDYCVCGEIKKKDSSICLSCKGTDKTPIEERSYKDLKNKYNGDWYRARMPIAKNARKSYDRSGKDKKCYLCGYDKHVEICHIKAVADFDENTLIKEINSPDNLVALCRNHHWELDNGLIKL